MVYNAAVGSTALRAVKTSTLNKRLHAGHAAFAGTETQRACARRDARVAADNQWRTGAIDATRWRRGHTRRRKRRADTWGSDAGARAGARALPETRTWRACVSTPSTRAAGDRDGATATVDENDVPFDKEAGVRGRTDGLRRAACSRSREIVELGEPYVVFDDVLGNDVRSAMLEDALARDHA